MTLRRALGPCAVVLSLAAAGPSPAAAQSVRPLAERSLLTTAVRDERAVWVNPAGLARSTQASLAADLTVERADGEARLAQYGLAFSSRSLAFGWEHDRLLGGSSTNTYVVGFGLGDELFSGGVAHRWYQGGKGGWDVALRGRATDGLDLSLVWHDIGSPLVRGVVVGDRFVPAAGFRLLEGRILAGVEGDIPGDLSTLSEFRAGAGIALSTRIVVACRATFSRETARRGVVVFIGFGGRRYRGSFAGLFPEGGGLGAVGADGAVIADLAGPSRR
jgi:hypothetical protein